MTEVNYAPIPEGTSCVKIAIPDFTDPATGEVYSDIEVVVVTEGGSPKRLARAAERAFGVLKITKMAVEEYQR